ncbi:MAG TPA: class I SAM-dependent methyltransferase [Candidatus Binatia bacterium]|nr:class I SAM-dependent methyltransferase [Candidatus Binatia bacterium]
MSILKLKPEIRVYYDTAAEEDRLQSGPSQLEFVRTQAILRRTLPPPPATILDVGGGPGSYALWLAKLGYGVHLIDPVPRHVAQAQVRSQQAVRQITTCTVGDARDLQWAAHSIDAVLLLGPLYHLTDRTERLKALQEACRVLVSGGCLFAAGISRFASVLDGLSRDLFADPPFWKIVEQDLREGIHHNETGKLEYFTTAQFHRPEELEEEINEAGFTEVAVLGLEGVGWLFPDFAERWRDARRRDDLLRAAQALEREESIRGVSAHLLAVARKPAGIE